MFNLFKSWFSEEQQEDSIVSLYENEDEFNEVSENLDNFDQEFLSRVSDGEPYQLFLSIGGQQECALIQSLLYSEGIPSYVENQNFNRFYGGAPTAMTAVFSIKLYILSKDYDDAYKIVSEFCNFKKDVFDEYHKEKSTIPEKIFYIISGIFFTPYPTTVKQKGMGISIFPKIELEE